MTLSEKRSIVHLIVMLLYVAVCAVLFVQRHPAGISDATLDYRFLALAVLLLIPTQIVVAIVFAIAYGVRSKASAKEVQGLDFEDERDKLIELKSLRNAYQTFLAGFLLSMLVVALGGSLTAMFILLASTFVLALLAWYASQFYFYRRGF